MTSWSFSFLVTIWKFFKNFSKRSSFFPTNLLSIIIDYWVILWLSTRKILIHWVKNAGFVFSLPFFVRSLFRRYLSHVSHSPTSYPFPSLVTVVYAGKSYFKVLDYLDKDFYQITGGSVKLTSWYFLTDVPLHVRRSISLPDHPSWSHTLSEIISFTDFREFLPLFV